MINYELHLESTSATKFGVLAVILLRVEAASFRGCSTTATAHRATATAHRAATAAHRAATAAHRAATAAHRTAAATHRAASTTHRAATHSSTTLAGTATLARLSGNPHAAEFFTEVKVN